MSIIFVSILLVMLLVYIIATVIYINASEDRRKVREMMDATASKETIKTFAFEDKILKKLRVEPSKVHLVLWVERILIVGLLIFGFVQLRGIMLCAAGAVVICFVADDSYKKVVYDSGIENIGRVTNFINYFVPHINSGNSADQSFLGYVDYSKDEDLLEYYENRNNPNYTIPAHLKQIVDIYDVAKYNEEMGISDYTYIMNELSQDMAQKQVYYNSFISRIGEIKPIMWSYYIGVPILIGVSFSQTYDFWMGGGGIIVAVVLLIMFGLFKFLIYKLQKKTIMVIF